MPFDSIHTGTLGLCEHFDIACDRHRPLLCHCASLQVPDEAQCVLVSHRTHMDCVHINLVAAGDLHGPAKFRQWQCQV